MPEISVVMSAHNPGRHFEQAVESIRAQTFTDWEMLIADNASTDGAIDAYMATCEDPRIKIRPQPTNLSGGGGGCEVLIPECTGAYFARMDADDISHPDRLAVQLAALKAQPHWGLVSCTARYIDEQDNPGELHPTLFAPDEIKAATNLFMPILDPACMYTREAQEKHPYRAGLRYSNDYERLARLVEEYPAAVLPHVLFSYRRHGGGVSGYGVRFQAISSSAIRLMAWRRRHGNLPEQYDAEALHAKELAEKLETPAQAFRHYARRASAEGFHILAAHQTRLALRADATPRALCEYLWRTGNAVIRTKGALRHTLRRIAVSPSRALLETEGIPERAMYL